MNSKQTRHSVNPARRRAFDILSRVETERAYASVLVATPAKPEMSREDLSLTQEIVLGVLRWRGSLDFFIERYSGRAIDRFDLPVLLALRMGLYQLRHLTRIPQSAAVNESVNLVKQAGVASAGGLVNAVLRKAADNLGEQAGHGIADPLERASIELSHSRWMLERWRAAFGEDETRQLALANNAPAKTAFRVNTVRATVDDALAHLNAEGITIRSSELVPGAFVVDGGPASVIAQAAQQGLIYVQDPASQLVSIILDAKPGDRVLDLCAAPGSKSSHIAALTEDKAWIIACDLRPHRLTTLRATCRRLGIESVDALAFDATQPLPFGNAREFDRLLVDAPCSGTGTLRGNPEIKWRLSPENITRLAEFQLSILERAASSVARAGKLVYSTCSLEREENEEVVSRFLAIGSRFRIAEPDTHAGVITREGFVRTYPHRQGTDGFFAAVLERVG